MTKIGESNFVQLCITNIDEILRKCNIVQGWKNIFWVEAASFIGVGMVVESLAKSSKILYARLLNENVNYLAK